jgi:hypothetical protein
MGGRLSRCYVFLSTFMLDCLFGWLDHLLKSNILQGTHTAGEVIDGGSKTMITYNCHECGSWSNQYMGRTTVKGENTKFQLSPGPSTDMNCPHCKGRQHVHSLLLLTLLTISSLDQCGVVPSTTANSSRKQKK